MKTNWPTNPSSRISTNSVHYGTKKLGEVCDFRNGLWNGKKPPFVMAKVIRNTNFKNNDGTINFDDVAEIEVEEKQLSDRLLKQGDIILERSGGGPTQPVGRVVYFNTDGEFSFSNFTSLVRVLNSKELDSEYLWRYLNFLYISGITEKIQKQTTGIRNLNFSDYKELEIPIPPLSEQKRIVAKLEKLLGKIDEAKRLRAESLDAAQNLLPAELHKIFEEGKKKGWKEKEIKDICEHPQYGFTESSSREKIGPKFLRITDIQGGKVNWEKVPYCKCNEVKKYQLAKGDIVFARTGATVGKSYLINEVPADSIFASYLIRLRVLDSALPNFLYYFFQSPDYWQQITDEQIGMAQPNVNGSRLAKIKIPFPSLTEQKKIVARLDSLSEKVNQLKKLQSATTADLSALSRSILHQAFDGEL